jgi:hypothetical protein
LQKLPEPGGILKNDINKKYSGEGKKKNGQVHQKNDNTNQDPLFFTHDGFLKASELN